MMTQSTVANVKAVGLTSKLFRDYAEANVDNMTPVQAASALRIAAAMEAAEKMADAIERYYDGDVVLGAAAEAFRMAMRGEL